MHVPDHGIGNLAVRRDRYLPAAGVSDRRRRRRSACRRGAPCNPAVFERDRIADHGGQQHRHPPPPQPRMTGVACMQIPIPFESFGHPSSGASSIQVCRADRSGVRSVTERSTISAKDIATYNDYVQSGAFLRGRSGRKPALAPAGPMDRDGSAIPRSARWFSGEPLRRVTPGAVSISLNGSLRRWAREHGEIGDQHVDHVDAGERQLAAA